MYSDNVLMSLWIKCYISIYIYILFVLNINISYIYLLLYYIKLYVYKNIAIYIHVLNIWYYIDNWIFQYKKWYLKYLYI